MMIYVQWKSGANVPGKVHMSQHSNVTLCGRPIKKPLLETEKPPRDKTTNCQHCRLIDAEQQRFQHLLK